MDKQFNLVCDGSSSNKKLEAHLAEIMVERFELWKEKQKRYGSTNISALGTEGILVRLRDKYSRAWELLKGQEASSDESLRDTLMDGANYFDMATVCSDGNWPVHQDPALSQVDIIDIAIDKLSSDEQYDLLEKLESRFY